MTEEKTTRFKFEEDKLISMLHDLNKKIESDNIENVVSNPNINLNSHPSFDQYDLPKPPILKQQLPKYILPKPVLQEPILPEQLLPKKASLTLLSASSKIGENWPNTNLIIQTKRLFQEPEFIVNLNLLNAKRQKICKKQILTICSGGPVNSEARKTQRDKFQSSNLINSHLFFIIGNGVSLMNLQKISLENEINKDFIYLDFQESYDLLTVKTLASMLFFEKLCENDSQNTQKWLVHVDDDVQLDFTGVERLVDSRTLDSEKIYCLDKALMKNGLGLGVHRMGKYKVSEKDFEADIFPTACAGTAFMMEMGVVKELLRIVRHPMGPAPFRLEDVYVTGVLRAAANFSDPVGIRPKLAIHGH